MTRDVGRVTRPRGRFTRGCEEGRHQDARRNRPRNTRSSPGRARSRLPPWRCLGRREAQGERPRPDPRPPGKTRRLQVSVRRSRKRWPRSQRAPLQTMPGRRRQGDPPSTCCPSQQPDASIHASTNTNTYTNARLPPPSGARVHAQPPTALWVGRESIPATVAASLWSLTSQSPVTGHEPVGTRIAHTSAQRPASGQSHESGSG